MMADVRTVVTSGGQQTGEGLEMFCFSTWVLAAACGNSLCVSPRHVSIKCVSKAVVFVRTDKTH